MFSCFSREWIPLSFPMLGAFSRFVGLLKFIEEILNIDFIAGTAGRKLHMLLDPLNR